MRVELLGPIPATNRWRDCLASLDESARNLERALEELIPDDDVLRTIAALTVPDLADYCVIDAMEGDRSVRSVVACRSSQILASVGPLVEKKTPAHAFAEGRRALSGKPAFMRFSAATVRRPELRAGETPQLIRLLAPRSGIFLPFVVMGTTVAIAGLTRNQASGLIHGKEDLALAEEVARRALIRQAGFSGPRFIGGEDARLRRAEAFLRAHVGAPLSLAALAREAGLSRFHLLRLFKQTYGETPFRRLARLRLEEAQRRLMRTQDSITEIAFACGHESPAHFAAAFRREFGVAPKDFRSRTRQSSKPIRPLR
jgi:AraC-like DNA-binding protein